MSKLIFLGTGHAMVTKCYNTCFLIENDDKYLLVDTGGGNKILEQLEKSNIDINHIHDIFITHNHLDHMLGLFWLIQCIYFKIKSNSYIGDLNIYIANENADLAQDYIKIVYPYMTSLFGNRIKFINILDKMQINIINSKLSVLDLKPQHSSQYGFKIKFPDNKILSFFGDIPYNEDLYEETKYSDYIIHEAFCLEVDREVFKPYKICHSTVKDACEVAKKLNTKNLILVHTEDSKINKRKELYVHEAKKYFDGNVLVPNDLEEIEL